jgi:replication fork protection complex subunit Csm3/Swi3
LEEDEEEAFWKSLDEYAGDSSDVPPASTTAANSSADEDEFMWDVLDEVESTSMVKLAGTASVPPPSTNSVEVSTTANPNAADDWDDMYL